MTAKNVPISIQYRSPEYVVLFTPKPDNTLTVKIYTIACKTVYNFGNNRSQPAFNFGTQFIPEKIYYHQRVFKTNIPNPKIAEPLPLLKSILEGNPLQRRICPKEITIQDCIEEAKVLIHQAKLEVWLGSEQIETFHCPITLEIFKNPVKDDHGHTFEQDAIEQHLKEHKTCPLSREPIRSLAPNLEYLQKIQQAQTDDPIPTFSLFKKENQGLARGHMETAISCQKAGKFQEALQSYYKAFEHTNRPSDYQPIVQLFQKMNEQNKAVLALFYLSMYLLQENKVQEAISTLESILKIDSASSASLLLAKLYQINQNREMALNFLLKNAKAIAFNSEKSLALYKQAVSLAPNQFELYRKMQSLACNPQEKAHYLFMGVCHALQCKDFPTAESLCSEAKKLSNLFLDQLMQIEFLKKTHANGPQAKTIVEENLQKLALFYRQNKLFEEQLKVEKLLVAKEEKLSHCKNIAWLYEELKKPNKAAIWYHKQLNFLIQGNELQKADALADKILSKDFKEVAVYETLKAFYEQQKSEKLSVIYGKLGKNHLEKQQLDKAEVVFNEGLQKFPCSIECAMGLAKVFKLQKKFTESVQQYYAAADIAFVDDQLNEVNRCLQQIKELDPSLKLLQPPQRMNIMLLSKIANLQKEMMDQKKEIADLKKEVNDLKGERQGHFLRTQSHALIF